MRLFNSSGKSNASRFSKRQFRANSWLARLETLEDRKMLTGATDDVSVLSDEFNDAGSIANWSEINEVEGWGAAGAQLNRWNVNTDQAGQMILQPHTGGWYEDWRGALVFKEITGDFVVTSRVQITDRDDVGGSDPDNIPDDGDYSLGGLMIRTPRNITNGLADWNAGSRIDDASNNGENYIFLSMGFTTGANNFSFEVKSTRNSSSNLQVTPLGQTINEVELKIARIGTSVITLYRLAGEQEWTVHRRYERDDMPETLQVGMVAYTDWNKLSDFPPTVHNGAVLAPGQVVDPTPWEAFNPDITAAYDYTRFSRPVVPAELSGVNLVTQATNQQLLSFLGDAPVVEPDAESVTDDAFVVSEDAGELVLDVLANDDVGLDALITGLDSTSTFGQVTIAADGRSLLYTPAADFVGEDSFEYSVTLANGDELNGVVTVTVQAVNDAPVLNDAVFVVAENSANGTPAGTVQAVDTDGDTLTYSIVGGNELGIFAIDPASGQISVVNNANLDREAVSVIHLIIQVADNGAGGGLQNTAEVTISVSDVNEFAPVVTSPGVFYRAENSISVGSVTATDADLPSQTLTYAITGGADAARFSMTSAGALSFQSPPDFEMPTDVGGNNVYDLIFTAYDGAGLATAQAIVVKVTNLVETPLLNVGGAAVTWVAGKAAVKVFPQLQVSNTVSLGGGKLTLNVDPSSYLDLVDVFNLPSFASIGVANSKSLSSGKLTIEVQLHQNVKASAIQDLLRKITFETKGLGVLLPTRNLCVSLTTATGLSTTVSQTIHVRSKR